MTPTLRIATLARSSNVIIRATRASAVETPAVLRQSRSGRNYASQAARDGSQGAKLVRLSLSLNSWHLPPTISTHGWDMCG